MKTIKALAIAIVFTATAAVTSGTSYANNEASVNHEISLADINHVVLNNSVGSIYVSEGEDDYMQLRVEFEGKRSGMLRRVKDVSDVDVTIHGGQDVRTNRAIVAETTRGRGNGEYPISVSVGVGDAGIRLY